MARARGLLDIYRETSDPSVVSVRSILAFVEPEQPGRVPREEFAPDLRQIKD